MKCANSKCPKTCSSLQLPKCVCKGLGPFCPHGRCQARAVRLKARGRSPSGQLRWFTGSSTKTRRDSLVDPQGPRTAQKFWGRSACEWVGPCHHQPHSGPATSQGHSQPPHPRPRHPAAWLAFLWHFCHPLSHRAFSPARPPLHQSEKDVGSEIRPLGLPWWSKD